jgi:hypothetical protein
MKNKKINKEDLWCEYSDLPSPMAYIDCTDYDSMGNHGRFPTPKNKNIKMKRKLQKLLIWLSYKFNKKSKKNIWEL